MTRIEEELREALDESARRIPVDTTRMWHATRARMRPRRRRLALVPLAAVAAVAAAAIAVPVGAQLLRPDPEAGTPTTTQPVQPRHSTPPPWQYEFTAPTAEALEYAKVQARASHVDGFEPVDFVRTPDGAFVLWASYDPDPANGAGPDPGRLSGLCWQSNNIEAGTGGGSCEAAGLPMEDPAATSNKWLSSGHLLDYPYYGGDGLESPMKLRFAAGQANNDVARVDGIDSEGRHHEAKLVGGREADWPVQEYFVIVEEPVEIVKYAAYDADGELLGSVPSD